MKNAIYVVVALLVGLVLGAWSGKSDLRTLREEVDKLKTALRNRDSRQDSLRQVTSMLRLPEPTEPAVAPPATTQPPSPAEPVTVGELPTDLPPPRESMEEQIQMGVDLWKTRSALARDGFLNNVAASPVQLQMFDQATARMNEQLAERIRQWADYVKQQQAMTAETGLRMMNDLSQPVIAAYDDLDKSFGTDWREQAGEKFQMFDFINPEVALPFAEVEDTIDHSPFRRGRHRRE